MEVRVRTNIDIDDELMAAAINESGKSTKKGAVEEALRHFVKVKRQLRALENLRGIGWDAPPMSDRHFREDGSVYYPSDDK
jgi:Arc/MetJ family transcription regulator